MTVEPRDSIGYVWLWWVYKGDILEESCANLRISGYPFELNIAMAEFQCPKCFIICGDFHELLLHQLRGHIPEGIRKGPTFCQICDTKESSFLEMLVHAHCRHANRQSIELSSSATTCGICNEVFPSIWLMLLHKDVRHGSSQTGGGNESTASTSSSDRKYIS